MTSVIIIVLLNLAFLGWVVRLIVRDPGNVFRRRPPPAGDDGERDPDDRRR